VAQKLSSVCHLHSIVTLSRAAGGAHTFRSPAPIIMRAEFYKALSSPRAHFSQRSSSSKTNAFFDLPFSCLRFTSCAFENNPSCCWRSILGLFCVHASDERCHARLLCICIIFSFLLVHCCCGVYISTGHAPLRARDYFHRTIALSATKGVKRAPRSREGFFSLLALCVCVMLMQEALSVSTRNALFWGFCVLTPKNPIAEHGKSHLNALK